MNEEMDIHKPKGRKWTSRRKWTSTFREEEMQEEMDIHRLENGTEQMTEQIDIHRLEKSIVPT